MGCLAPVQLRPGEVLQSKVVACGVSGAPARPQQRGIIRGLLPRPFALCMSAVHRAALDPSGAGEGPVILAMPQRVPANMEFFVRVAPPRVSPESVPSGPPAKRHCGTVWVRRGGPPRNGPATTVLTTCNHTFDRAPCHRPRHAARGCSA